MPKIGVITILSVMRRRSQANEEEARVNSALFSYQVRINENGQIHDVPVCIKAFIHLLLMENRFLSIVENIMYDLINIPMRQSRRQLSS